jgi:hypothetical protein
VRGSRSWVDDRQAPPLTLSRRPLRTEYERLDVALRNSYHDETATPFADVPSG